VIGSRSTPNYGASSVRSSRSEDNSCHDFVLPVSVSLRSKPLSIFQSVELLAETSCKLPSLSRLTSIQTLSSVHPHRYVAHSQESEFGGFVLGNRSLGTDIHYFGTQFGCEQTTSATQLTALPGYSNHNVSLYTPPSHHSNQPLTSHLTALRHAVSAHNYYLLALDLQNFLPTGCIRWLFTATRFFFQKCF